MMTDQARDGDRDALAYTLATLQGDHEARRAIVLHCDPAATVDSLVTLFVGSLAMAVGAHRVESVLQIWQAGAAASASGSGGDDG